MSRKEWLVMWLLFAAYLFMGASVFYTIEREEEENRKNTEAEEKQLVLKNLLVQLSNTGENVTDVLNKAARLCPSGAQDLSKLMKTGTTDDTYLWTYYNAFFFTLTTLSTIGYGNLTPTTNEGKMLVIVYSLIGIPFTGIILAHMGDWFGSRFLRAHHRYKSHVYESKLTLILDVLTYLVPGLAVFIIAPTVIFMYFESWTFYQSIYYSYITLSTIGFGDLVAGQTASGDEVWHLIYKIFIIFWIMFGLGYLVMILEFITRGMKSKRINRIERKLAHTIRQTHTRLWQEFIEDVNSVRKTLNENYIDGVKPVYKDRNRRFSETQFLSNSAPELSEWPVPISRRELEELKEREERENAAGVVRRRRRAFSEIDETLRDQLGLPRRASHGAIHDIDLAATFRDTPRPSIVPGDIRPDDLVHLMGRRLSVMHPTLSQEGVNLFTDDEILHSERQVYSTRSSGSWTEVEPRKRDRARSDAMFMRVGPITVNYDQQKTWSGGEDLRKVAMVQNMKKSQSSDAETGGVPESKERLGKPSPTSNLRRLSVAALNFFSGDKKKNKDKPGKGRKSLHAASPSSPGARSLDEDFDEDEDELNYITARGMRRASMLDILGPQRTVGGGPPLNPFLEQTSVADFIRAMATLRQLHEQQLGSGDPFDTRMSASGDNLQIPGGRSQSRHPSLSYLFQQPPVSSSGIESPSKPPPPPWLFRRPSQQPQPLSTPNFGAGAKGLAQRRLSQVPSTGPVGGGFRKRAASIAPGSRSDSALRSSGRFFTPLPPLLSRQAVRQLSTPPTVSSQSTTSSAQTSAPPAPPPPPPSPPIPSVLITSPDGEHQFHVSQVPTISEYVSPPPPPPLSSQQQLTVGISRRRRGSSEHQPSGSQNRY